MSKLMLVLSLIGFLFGSTLVGAAPKLVFDVRTGEVLHAEQADDPWYPASVTKLMTSYVALRAVREGRLGLDSILVATDVAVAQPPSKIGIPKGRSITLRNALHILIVKSANDIAVVVAEGVSGSVEAFSDEMNQTARRLGMRGSRFVNPHGLPDENQVTTARDMAILTRALLREFPEIIEITNLPAIKVGGQTIRSYNGLLGHYSGADGMKTGFICAAGFNMVATATRRGRRIGAVVFGQLSPDHRRVEAEKLLNIGFSKAVVTEPERVTLFNLSREGAAAAPVNMRPEVCGGTRASREGLPERRAIAYSVPIIPIRFGQDVAVLPLPKPRPDDLPKIEVAEVAEEPVTEATEESEAAPKTVELAVEAPVAEATTFGVPLPLPRPELP